MASPRYTLNIKPEDLQPEQPKHEMTGKEKRENFWFYHKWHVIVGIVAALMVFSFVWEIATQVHPDYTIGILTTTGVPMAPARHWPSSSSRILTTATATERSL